MYPSPHSPQAEMNSSQERKEFLVELNRSMSGNLGFAAGKLGYSEQVWLASQGQLDSSLSNPKKYRAIRTSAIFHACNQSGAFPPDVDFLDDAVLRFTAAVKDMDFLATFQSPLVPEIIRNLEISGQIIGSNDLEPNRNIPYNPHDCYLPTLRNKKILLITTPSELLASRANKSDFEAIWESTGCPWFFPKSVEALAFPSVFDAKTQSKFASSQELLAWITGQISSRDFDIALIGASGLGMPIASYVKNLGKVGLSLGGHLQVLFGVQGKRWRDDLEWQSKYHNDAWIDMPEEFAPQGQNWVADDGAYW